MLTISAIASGQTLKPLKSDTQFWNDTQLTVPVNKQVDFVLTLTTRTRRNITVLADERWGVGWVLKVNKYLSFNPFYFHREADPPHLRHEREDRLTLGATLRFPVKKFMLVERNWFERRWREPQVDAWRYRNRIQLEHPFTLNKAKFTGYVADEVFHDWSIQAFHAGSLSHATKRRAIEARRYHRPWIAVAVPNVTSDRVSDEGTRWERRHLACFVVTYWRTAL